MIVVLKKGTEQKEIDKLTKQLEEQGVIVNPVVGKDLIILGLVGDTSAVDEGRIEANRNVERVMHVAEPFKRPTACSTPNPPRYRWAMVIGGNQIQVIAGPCSVESEAQITGIAKQVKEMGAHLLRGGAFKPRTSPYAFQGLASRGLEPLKQAREQTGCPSSAR